MTNLEALTEAIPVDVTLFELKEADVQHRVVRSLLEKIAHTGLKFDDVAPKVNFEVTVSLAGNKGDATGKGTTYESALADAAKSQPYDNEKIKIGITGNIDIPYFLHQVRGRGLSENAALETLEASVKLAKDKYQKRLQADVPQSITAIVQLSSADYASSTSGIPDPIGKKKLLARGDYHPSKGEDPFTAAKALAYKNKADDRKVRDAAVVSEIYEVRQSLIVYGLEDGKARPAVYAAAQPAKPAPIKPYAPPTVKPAEAPYSPPSAVGQPAPTKPASSKPKYQSPPAHVAAPTIAAASAAVSASQAHSSGRSSYRSRGSPAGNTPAYAPSPMKLA